KRLAFARGPTSIFGPSRDHAVGDLSGQQARENSAIIRRSDICIHLFYSYELRCCLFRPGCAPVGAPFGGNKIALSWRYGPSGSPGNGSSIGSKSRFTRSAVMLLLISCRTVSLVA